ncbi:hypothetical protein CH330_00640 [candidate division WOR-3 bacterium JGI_Cruoil_03_51_56]|uniref:Uncharacterized protein n=1 Tax=candidate division WOR-3 bacterium JGI_Cruoil_03_51_56 TaxID=1973747 RepID=A0A235BZK7_UNCW3|nr:MAG: hypothetical protein CH330_00640 [candidate division WOR-3 bacterium JGI_Cruoil_03_51_56]
MKEADDIVTEIKTRVPDSKHEEAIALWNQVLSAFNCQSSQGVTNVVGARLSKLRNAYDDAHQALMRKMGRGSSKQ